MRVSGSGEVFFASRGRLRLPRGPDRRRALGQRPQPAGVRRRGRLGHQAGAGRGDDGRRPVQHGAAGHRHGRAARGRPAGHPRLQPAADVRRRAGGVAWSANLVPAGRLEHEHALDAARRHGGGVPVRLPRPGFRRGPAERVGPGARWAATGERRAARRPVRPRRRCRHTRWPIPSCWPRCGTDLAPPASPSTARRGPGALAGAALDREQVLPGGPRHPRHGRRRSPSSSGCSRSAAA